MRVPSPVNHFDSAGKMWVFFVLVHQPVGTVDVAHVEITVAALLEMRAGHDVLAAGAGFVGKEIAIGLGVAIHRNQLCHRPVLPVVQRGEQREREEFRQQHQIRAARLIQQVHHLLRPGVE